MSKKQWQQLTIGIILAILLIVANTQGWLSPLRSFAGRLTSPMQGIIYPAGNSIYKITKKIQQIPALQRENDALRQENIRLQAHHNDTESIQRENERLRNELTLLPKEPYELIGAHIIGIDPNKTQQVRTLNRGTKHNVHVNDAVIVQNSVVVGKIIEASVTTSKLMLLQSEKSAINVTTNTEETIGVVKGDHGIGLLLDLVPQSTTLEVGAQVISSGLGRDFPKNLTIGTIDEIKKNDNSVFQQAFIKSPIEVKTLNEVFIITNTSNIE